MVPSEVICGVTSSSSTASTNWTETVLLTIVCTGILVPCLMVAFSLFCVITFGLDRSLPTPLSSAAVIMRSNATFADEKEYWMPLVGEPTPRFVAKGIDPDVLDDPPDPTTMGGAGRGGKLRMTGLVPTPDVPPKTLLLLGFAAARPNCVPISREKERLAATTRASISTCRDFRSSWRIRLSITGIVLGTSRMIRVFERSSATRSPRDERNFLSVAASSVALA